MIIMGYYANLAIETTETILAALAENGGTTVDPDTGAELAAHGYVVAIGAPYTWTRKLSLTRGFDHDTVDFVQQYVNNSATWIHDLGDVAVPVFVGAWLDTDTDILYLDLVQICSDRDFAIELGRERNEIAIFDTATGEDIRIDYTNYSADACEAHPDDYVVTLAKSTPTTFAKSVADRLYSRDAIVKGTGAKLFR